MKLLKLTPFAHVDLCVRALWRAASSNERRQFVRPKRPWVGLNRRRFVNTAFQAPSNQWNSRNELTQQTLPDPDGSGPSTSPVWSYAYTTLGQRYQTTDPMNHVEAETFDADGHVLTKLDNLGHGDTNTYGHGGELLTATDSLNHTSSDQYDSRFRLVQTTDANNGVTQITLDGVGNRTRLVDPANNQTTWVLDALNRPTSETNALGTTYTTYDASSDVTSIQDADGRVRDFTLDNLHRLTGEQWMNGNTVVAQMSYGYDAANELTSASDPNSAYAFAFNGDGQVTSVDNSGTPNIPHVVLTSGYDLGGDRTSLSTTVAGTADFINNYGFDNDQRLTLVQQQQQTGGNTVASKEVDFGYNALSQVTSTADYNYIGVGPRQDMLTGAYSYDTANRLTGLAYTSDGGANTIDTLGWGYNVGNLVTSFTSVDGTASYGYDPTNQLTSATYTTNSGGHQPANESYSFDLNGNRSSTGYTTGSANLMTSDGTFNYQHDADGNQTVRTRISNSYASDYRTNFSWDYRNRLTDVEYFDNNSVLTKHVHFVYDVFDHLLATEVDPNGGGSYTSKEFYALDVSPETPQAGVPGTALAQPVLKFDGNGNPTERFLEIMNRIYAEGAVPSLNQADTVTWDALDNLGTPRDIVNNSGALVNHRVFSSFGQDVYESNPSVTSWTGFAGGHLDPATGEVNDYHRWYDPAPGHWLSEDPLDFGAGDSNLTRYLGNSPTSGVDPLGLHYGTSPSMPGPPGTATVPSSWGGYVPPPGFQLKWPTTPSGQPASGPPQLVPIPTKPVGPQPGDVIPTTNGNWIFIPAQPASFPLGGKPKPALPPGFVFIPNKPPMDPDGAIIPWAPHPIPKWVQFVANALGEPPAGLDKTDLAELKAALEAVNAGETMPKVEGEVAP